MPEYDDSEIKKKTEALRLLKEKLESKCGKEKCCGQKNSRKENTSKPSELYPFRDAMVNALSKLDITIDQFNEMSWKQKGKVLITLRSIGELDHILASMQNSKLDISKYDTYDLVKKIVKICLSNDLDEIRPFERCLATYINEGFNLRDSHDICNCIRGIYATQEDMDITQLIQIGDNLDGNNPSIC